MEKNSPALAGLRGKPIGKMMGPCGTCTVQGQLEYGPPDENGLKRLHLLRRPRAEDQAY